MMVVLPLPPWVDTTLLLKVVQVTVVGVFAVFAYRRDMLNAMGAFVAFVMGALIVAATNIFWLLILFSLLGMGTVATKFRYAEKEEQKIAEKDKGRRRSRNVIANGLPPTLLAAATPLLAGVVGHEAAAITYVAAVAVAASDTVASEVGSVSGQAYLITTLKPVPPGTDGGVSAVGQVAAAAGALATAAIGWLLLAVVTGEMAPSVLTLAIPAAAGFVGCQVDSLIGATLETKGLVTKEEVNAISIVAGAGLALAASLLFL